MKPLINNTWQREQINAFPKWFGNQTFLVFCIAFALCSILFGYVMELRYAVVAVVSTLLFCLGGSTIYRRWHRLSAKIFCTNLFWVALTLRLIWMLYCYLYFNMDFYNYVHGDDADTGWYMDFAKDIANWVTGGFQDSFESIRLRNDSAIDDVGYPFWLAIEYLFVGVENDTFVPMVIKCVISSICVIFMYNIALRHFGENVARVTAIFVALYPNLIYWCGTMFKEPEMLFLCCWFLDEMDKALTNNVMITMKALLPAILLGMSLFFFRSALGLIGFLAMFGQIVFGSQRIMSMGKKVLAGVLVVLALLVGMGENIRTQTQNVVESVQSDDQNVNMEWRGTREGGNSFAKYATATVFAPLIFTIPFPTFNMANENQVLQLDLSGGNLVKNILSFFVILSMFFFLFSGEWRRHVFIIAYTCGYLAALVLSNFAQSGRFHIPVIPLLLLFGAFGISLVQQNKRVRKYWPMVLVAEVAICLFWNWFKLKGRGMI